DSGPPTSTIAGKRFPEMRNMRKVTSPPRVVVVGSINMDSTIEVPRLPRPGETIAGTGHHSQLGGKGANQAVAAAQAGAHVQMVGAVGTDLAGSEALRKLESYGVHTHLVVEDSRHPTGVAHIHVDQQGEN